jgi:hypothetical protein
LVGDGSRQSAAVTIGAAAPIENASVLGVISASRFIVAIATPL